MPHPLHPCTPVHVLTCSPVAHIIISWYVDTLLLPWCRDIYLDVKILWVKILWVKTVYTLMSRRWSYRRIVMRWYVCLFGVVISIHGSIQLISIPSIQLTINPLLCWDWVSLSPWGVFTSLVYYMCNVVNKRSERPCEAFWFATGMLTLGGLKDDYSVLSPLTGLRGRNGGLGLKCR